MSMQLKTLSRSTAGLLLSFGVLIAGCDDGDDVVLPTLSTTTGSPPPVVVAPTLEPVEVPTPNSRPAPNFPEITPPPIVPDLPTEPTGILEFNQDASIALGYEVILQNLFVRGVIADVNVQVVNVTCQTDVTAVLAPDAVSQFKSLLIGRGNTDLDATIGIVNTTTTPTPQFDFIFPTDVSFFNDGRILFKAFRTFTTLDSDPNDDPDFDAFLSGDDVVFYLTITDTFGQVLRLSDSVFGGPILDEDLDERRITGCGAISDGLPNTLD